MNTREQLQATLRELEDELASLETLDSDVRAMLEEAVREIEAKLEAEPEVEGKSSDTDSMSDTLEESVARFETTHPTLTGIVRRLVDMLAQMGI